MNHESAATTATATANASDEIKPVSAFQLIMRASNVGIKNAKYDEPWHPWAKTLSSCMTKLAIKMALKDDETASEATKRLVSKLFWDKRREINKAWKLRFDLNDTACLPTHLRTMVEFYLQRLPTMTHDDMKALEKSRRADWKKDEGKWAKEIQSWETERTKWSGMIALACEEPKQRLSDEELQEIKDLVSDIRTNLISLQKQIGLLNLPEVKKAAPKRVQKAKQIPQVEGSSPVNLGEGTGGPQIDHPPGFEPKAEEFPQLEASAKVQATQIIAPQAVQAAQAPEVAVPVTHVQPAPVQPAVIQQIWSIPQLAPLQRLATADPNIFLWLDDQGRIIQQTPQGAIVLRQIVL